MQRNAGIKRYAKIIIVNVYTAEYTAAASRDGNILLYIPIVYLYLGRRNYTKIFIVVTRT